MTKKSDDGGLMVHENDPLAGTKVWIWEEFEALKDTWPDDSTSEEMIAEFRGIRRRIVSFRRK